MNAKLAFTAVSEIPLPGNRAAAINCWSEALTKALDVVPNAFLSLCHYSRALSIGRVGDGVITGHALQPDPDRRGHARHGHIARHNGCGRASKLLAHGPVSAFAKSRTSDRSHCRSSIASAVHSPLV